MIHLLDAPFSEAEELARFRLSCREAGALVSFTGYVRGEDEQIGALDLQHHPTLTHASLVMIERQTRARFAVDDILIIHRHGRLLPGETIVLVAAAARHRRMAFNAVDHAMDLLKTEAIFWKKEQRGDGDRWIEARAEDEHDRKRWEPKLAK